MLIFSLSWPEQGATKVREYEGAKYNSPGRVGPEKGTPSVCFRSTVDVKAGAWSQLGLHRTASGLYYRVEAGLHVEGFTFRPKKVLYREVRR